MNKRVDEALAKTEEQSLELQETSAAAAVQQEIQASIVVAQRFPRNEDEVYQKLMKTSERTSFAEVAQYSFPRGGTIITGPSVNMAREAARYWGNCRWGLEILRDDDETRLIRGWAWDLQTNTKVTSEDSFRKLIQRKPKGGGKAEWIKPDERDLRELTNRYGAILIRNCLLQMVPRDFVEDALYQCHQTRESGVAQDPDAARKRIIGAFAQINVKIPSLEKYLGHPISEASPTEIATLRTIFASIRDGNSRWSEYLESSGEDDNGKEKTPAGVGRIKVEDLRTAAEPPAEPKDPPAQPETPPQTPPSAEPAQAPEIKAETPPEAPAETRSVQADDDTEYYRTKVREELIMVRPDRRDEVLKQASIYGPVDKRRWLETSQVESCEDTGWLIMIYENLKKERTGQ